MKIILAQQIHPLSLSYSCILLVFAIFYRNLTDFTVAAPHTTSDIPKNASTTIYSAPHMRGTDVAPPRAIPMMNVQERYDVSSFDPFSSNFNQSSSTFPSSVNFSSSKVTHGGRNTTKSDMGDFPTTGTSTNGDSSTYDWASIANVGSNDITGHTEKKISKKDRIRYI